MKEVYKNLEELVTNYLYYKSFSEIEAKSYEKEIMQIISNINSFEEAQDYFEFLDTLNSKISKEELLRMFQKQIIYSKSKELILRLFFETNQFYQLNYLINDFDVEEVISYASLNLNKTTLNKLYLLYHEKIFNLIDIDKIPNNTISVLNINELVPKYYTKYSSRNISELINSNSSLTELIPYADDSSLNIIDGYPKDLEYLSKLKEKEFLKLLNEQELNNIINMPNLPKGIKLNIAMLYFRDENINVTEDYIINILLSLDDNSLNLSKNINYEKLKSVLQHNLILLSKMNSRFLTLGVFKNDHFSFEEKIEIIKYCLKYKIDIPIGTFNVVFSNNEISPSLFEDMVSLSQERYSQGYILKSQVEEETIIKYLNNPKYYENLNKEYLKTLLKRVSHQECVKALNNKKFLINLGSYISDLELDIVDIINNECIFNAYNKSLLSRLINSAISNEKIVILENKNVQKYLFGKTTLSKDDIQSIEYLIVYCRNINNSYFEINTKTLKSFTAMYLCFGIEDSLKIINLTNQDVNMQEILKLSDRTLQAKLEDFRIDHSYLLNSGYDELISLLNEYDDLSELKYYNVYNYFVEYSNMVIEGKAHKLMLSYIRLKNDNDEDELEKVKEDIRNLMSEARKHFIDEYVEKTLEEIEVFIKSNFKLRPEIVDRLLQKMLKSKKMIQAKSEFYVIMKSKYPKDIEKKQRFISIIKSSIDLQGICTYEYFEQEILTKVLNSEFHVDKFLVGLGYREPKNYKQYLFIRNMNREIKNVNNLFKNSNQKELIFNYLLGNSSDDEIKDLENISLIKEKKNVLRRYAKYLRFDDEKLYTKINIYYDEEACLKYDFLESKINKINKNIFKVLGVFFEKENIKVENDDFEQLDLPLNNFNYEIVKKPFTKEEINLLFSNFDFNSKDYLDGDNTFLKSFIMKNAYSIKLLSNLKNDYYAEDFGYILSHYKKLEETCKILSINVDDITIKDLKILQNYFLLSLTPLGESIDKDIISKIIRETDYIDELDISKRVDDVCDLIEEAKKRVSGTIPLIKTDEYEILDYHQPKNVITGLINPSCFRVCGQGNDFISYCLLNKNGSIIIIKNPKNPEEIIARVSAVRRGNVYFLHQLQIADKYRFSKEMESYCSKCLENLSKEVIDATAHTTEPIDFVTITCFNDIFQNKPLLSKQECPYLVDPIDIETEDYKEFKKYRNLQNSFIYNSFYHNYAAGKTAIICQNKDKKPKDYSAEPIYKRNREPYRRYIMVDDELPLNIEIEIRKLVYLNNRKSQNKKDATLNSKAFDLSQLSETIIGEDWLILKNKDGTKEIIELGYDIRSSKEIEEALSKEEKRGVYL